MSFEQGFIQYPLSKGTDAMKADLFFAPDPFFAPAPQLADAPSPDTFDLEVDNNKEVEDFDLELSFKQIDDVFATFRDTIPVAPTPTLVTDSTEASSQYSCDFTPSDYSILSEIESRGSVNDGPYSTHASVYSAAFSNSLLPIPPPSPAKAVPVQESASVAFSAAVHVVPDEAYGPVKPFKCPLCPFSSRRQHNLNTHIGTHSKSKPFQCKTCGRSFSRKHDRRRHCATIHGEQMSSPSSVPGASKLRFDPMPDLPDLINCITLNEDPKPMSSAYPGIDAAIDLPENIIAWLLEV